MHDFARIHTILCCMGAAINSIGTFQTAYAIYLFRHQPEKMMLATKQLYPAVAEHYGTSWKTVERNIRYTIARIWKRNPEWSSVMERPKTMQFIVTVAGIDAGSDIYIR